MDCVSVIVTPLLSFFQGVVDSALRPLRNLWDESAGNLFNLQKNMESLDKEMRELKEIRDDLENKVRNLERQPRTRRIHRLSGWLQKVNDLHGQVLSLRDSLAAGRPTSLRSDWVLAGKVARLLEGVRELRGKEADLHSQLVDDEAQPDPVVAVPSQSARLVGREEALSTIRSHLRNEQVGIIGIYGMGGEGKTALLAEINNQFLAQPQNDFDVVIWVTVSREPNVHKIQEDIGVRLGYARRGERGHPLPENEEDRRQALCRALGQKKFLLLLDDLWEKLDLEKIGVPRPNSVNCERSKIVFTTRLLDVCADMDVQHAKVRVGLLTERNSWKLFTSKVDAYARKVLDNNTGIQKLGKTVVRKCGGLPLALITMGRAMSNATRVGEWRQAVYKLRGFPDQIRGMKDVLSILKFSFDNLEDDYMRECLLYCALYPEDVPIWIPRLVDCWVGEGFLDADSSSDSGGLYEARDRGDCIIRKLKDSCLLESGNLDEDLYVKMHDVVCEMALWLTGGEFDRRQRFMVCDGERGMARLANATMWQEAKRITVTEDCELVQLPSLESRCGNLSTLRIRRWSGQTRAKQLVIPQNFWDSLPAVRVLDLPGTDLTQLSGAIASMTELRHLDLSYTGITQLPKELGKLVKLRQLILGYTRKLSRVPREAILTLTRLQQLDLFRSAYRWGDDEADDDSGGVKLSDVGCHLGRLEELTVTIQTVSCLQTLAQSEKLRKCAVNVELRNLENCTSLCASAALNKLGSIRFLQIQNCDCPLELKFVGPQQQREDQVGRAPHSPIFPYSLRHLSIFSWHGVKDLRWVGQLPQLECLDVGDCEALEELLVGDGLDGEEAADHIGVDDIRGCSFPKLKVMDLLDLPSLRRICGRPLLFPSLERLWVSGCPMLRRLPLGQQSCPKIKNIFAEQEWWDALEWDDYDPDSQSSSIKSAFAPFFEGFRYLYPPPMM